MSTKSMKSHLFNYHLPTYKVKIASKLASQTPAKENQVLLTNFFGTAKDRKLNKDDFRAPTSVEIRERDKTVVLNSVRLQSYISAAEDPTILLHYDKKGVKTDKYLRTSNSNIYSCGDCVEGMNFTHNSDI